MLRSISFQQTYSKLNHFLQLFFSFQFFYQLLKKLLYLILQGAIAHHHKRNAFLLLFLSLVFLYQGNYKCDLISYHNPNHFRIKIFYLHLFQFFLLFI